MKLAVVGLLGLLVSCSQAVVEVQKERSPSFEELAKERVRKDFEEFLRKANDYLRKNN